MSNECSKKFNVEQPMFNKGKVSMCIGCAALLLGYLYSKGNKPETTLLIPVKKSSIYEPASG